MAKILVVDDEPDALELVSFNLKAAGYEVVTADNGTEALKRAWTAASPAYRGHVSKDATLSAAWNRLKQIAQEVPA